ncbi:MAG: T9SS type A sorting domain-containing protein [Bacteroidales bacterium]|nr:T9SS type A sorting domain-containing protein [Bacteroidales bacterium]
MKKFYILIIALAFVATANAQWVNNPATNTYLVYANETAGEVYLATDNSNGDIYMQWCTGATNGWSPTLQRISAEGIPQWGNQGLHPSHHTLPSWSQGLAMAVTTDHAVVSCFATDNGQTVAIKINADGTYAWGEQGLTLFGNNGNSRTELLAGDDGGVWALGTDIDNGNMFIRYIEADGTMNPMITISDTQGGMCMFGLLVPTDNGIFVVYERETWAYTYYYNKELWVAGYNKNGQAISTATKLMDPQIIGGSYTHYVVPDGLGGGYAYIWHPAIGDAFNVYVFHFNADGISTFQEPDGIPVHSANPYYYYLDANATVDPRNHDLIITYHVTDAEYQSLSRIYVNRITTTGYKPWGDGLLVLDNGTEFCSDYMIDSFEDGSGFSIIYNRAAPGSYINSIIDAKGFDMEGNELWMTNMSSQDCMRSMSENSTGYHNGQNIVAWVNQSSGGIYGQNIGWNGGMGPNITPTPPFNPCYPPTDFQGETYYNPETGISAAVLSWTAPDPLPLHYNLYVEGLKEIIEIDAENTSYYLEEEPGDYIFKLTAWYEDCESDFALTPGGDNYVLVEIPIHQSINENEYENIVDIIEIFNINGQHVNTLNINELNQGIYIIKGVTETGKTVIRKMIR